MAYEEKTMTELREECERKRLLLGEVLDLLDETTKERDALRENVYQTGSMSFEERQEFRWHLMEMIQSLDDYQPNYGGWHRGNSFKLQDGRFVHLVMEVDTNSDVCGQPRPSRYTAKK